MKKHLCQNCVYYTAYYRQSSNSYSKLNDGYCSRHEKPKTRFEVCGEFKSNERKEKKREQWRLDNLDRALISINEIALILKEKEEYE